MCKNAPATMNLPISNRLAVIVLAGCVPAVWGAQSGLSAAVGANAPRVTLSGSATIAGDTDVEAGGVAQGEVSQREYDANVGIGFGSNFRIGLGYRLNDLELPDNNTSVALPERLRKVSMTLSYTRRLDDRWTGLLLLSPSSNTASGGEWSDSDGFGATFAAGARWRYSPTLTYTLGLRYDSLARRSYRLLPALGLEWKPGEPWTVTVGFPRTAVSYAVSTALRVSAVMEGSGGTYFVARDPLPGLAGKPSLANSKLEFYEIRTGLNAAYAFSRATSVGMTVGYVVRRKFDFHAAHYALRSRDGAPYVSVSASVGF